jgi:uncharacterized sulfatase
MVTSNRPLRGEKGTLYEGGIRVPLIVRWPGRVAAGTTCAVPVTSADFLPTILEMAGISPEGAAPLDGESLLPLLRGRGGLRRQAIYWHYPRYHHSTPAGAIREGRWKLIEFFEDNHVELYRLDRDLGETRDLSREQPEKARALRARLATWRKSVGAGMPRPNPDYDPARAGDWGR